MDQPVLALVALACLAASAVWGRSARYRLRVLHRIRQDSDDDDLQSLTQSDFRKDALSALLYLTLAVVSLTAAVSATDAKSLVLVLVAVPAVVSLILGRNFVNEARLEHGRTELERRAQEVLVQDEL